MTIMIDNMLVPNDELDYDSPWDPHPEFGPVRMIITTLEDGTTAVGAFDPADLNIDAQMWTMLTALGEHGAHWAGVVYVLEPGDILRNAEPRGFTVR